jgi:transposase
MQWLLYSPDLNLIERVWKHLKEWVYDHYPELLNMTGIGDNFKIAMVDALKEAWNAIEEDFLDKLVRSMKRRVQAVYDAEGWYTKY